MHDDVDVAIVGGGLMGAATAWAAARRGRSVALAEQFEPGHTRGSSHGSARIVRRAYEDGHYTRLTGRAFELWRELEHSSGRTLLRMLGGLDFGPRRNVPAIAAHLADAAVPHELLDAAEAEQRWPGMRFDGRVVYHAQAGTVDSAGAVAAFTSGAAAHGAQLQFGSRVTRIVAESDSAARLELADGSAISARSVVVAAGAWLAPLVGPLAPLPPLRVSQQQIFHFPRWDSSAPPWPSVIHEDAHPVYHLAGGRDGGPSDDRKIGEHDAGGTVTADARDGRVDPAARDRIVDYVKHWLPGLDPTPRGEATCLYTTTPTEDFVLDRVGSLVICSACSGHGAKFAPLLGELCADLALDARAAVPDRFRLAAHAAGRSAAVSL